ncbi:MAG: ROK family protein [Verrucomicrobiales bacterium]|nr:ROK family protein [Verrucomicrobiales bacterium]
MEQRYLGIEIGGTKLQLVLGNAEALIQQRWHRLVERDKGGAGIRDQIAATLSEICSTTSLSGIGVGFGGPVDWKTGKICCSHHIEGWSDFELGPWLEKLTQVPVRVDNDANTAALGEASQGAGLNFNPVFYVTLGSGVGGGLVVDGSIYHGAPPGEAEIGHVRLDRDGTIVESRCAGWAVDRRIRELVSKEPRSVLARMVGTQRGAEAKHLGAALDQNDEFAQKILAETAEDLAFGLSHAVHLMHPQVIVLGGGLSLLGEPLRAAVANALPRFVMDAFHPGPPVRLAKLREDAVPTGALVLAGAGRAVDRTWSTRYVRAKSGG